MKGNLKKARQTIDHLIIAFGICAILSALTRRSALSLILLVLGLIPGIAACIIAWRFFRCPYCGARLSAGHITTEHNHCTSCGKELEV